MHTVASDGRNTIEEMAAAAKERGYGYAAITDHSASHGFGDHVPPDELLRQIERVRSVRARRASALLAGTEVNVLPDGSLDYEDDCSSSSTGSWRACTRRSGWASAR